MEPLNIFEYEHLAKEHMSQASWDCYEGRSDDERNLGTSQADFARIRLHSHLRGDVTQCDTTTRVLRAPVQMPILVASPPLPSLAHPESECAIARGAGAAGALMIASTSATHPLEEIAQAASGPLWFQLPIDSGFSEVESELLYRAYWAGCQAIVLTLDEPMMGISGQFKQKDLEPRLVPWDMIDWVDLECGLPVLVRGIMALEDALLACEHAISGIIVSNRSGRLRAGDVTGIEALPEIVDAVAGHCEVYLEGGIRCGTDILKALALGARAVLIGRPVLWGLAVDGAPGVQRVLEILHTELDLAMKQAGCPTLASINRTLVKLL